MKSLEEKVRNLRECKEIQCSKGNYDQSEYMRGLANGLILAVAIMDNREPQYIKED